MRLTIALAISLLSFFNGVAQKGSYYLANRDLSEIGLENYNFDIQEDNQGLVYMANLKGVLVTDGRDWNLINTPYSVFALDLDNENNIYIGGRKEIAVVNERLSEQEAYRVISKVDQEVFEVKNVQDHVYFLTDNILYDYSVSTKHLNKLSKPSSDIFISLQEYKGNIYVASEEAGMQMLDGDTLKDSQIQFPDGVMGFAVSANEDVLAYTSEGNYYVKNSQSESFTLLNIDDEGYLDENTAAKVVWVNNSLVAISTISGGVVFINATTGKVEQYMTYENGLPDNEVLTLFSGKTHVFWCATPQGISVIAPEIPFRNYASYRGLSGNIQVVYEFNKELYVGTTVGLYRLVEKKDYEEVVSYKKITVPAEEIPEKKTIGLFKRKKQTQQKRKTYYSKQIEKKVSSVEHRYEKVEGIDTKVVQLLPYQGKLLIGTLSGIYEWDGEKVDKVFEQPIVYMYKPAGYPFLMVSTYDKKVEVLTKRGREWTSTGLLDGLNDFVEQIVQGNEKSLWLCGADSVYRIKLSSAYTLNDVEVYPINNPHWERVFSNPFQEKTYFLNSSGYFYYDDLSIKKDTILEKDIGLPQKMLLSSEGNLWVNTGHFWYGQGKSLKNSLNFISLFEDPTYLAEVGNNMFWVVAGKNQLYKIDGEKLSTITRPFKLFLERAQLDSIALPVTKELGKFDQRSALSFKFAAPDYTNIYQTEFQYRLKGLSNEWSEWSRNNNEIVFPYLPAGKYTLEVKARDALGNERKADEISFTVLAPYWKRSWFYLFEVLFFGGLMALSVWINKNSHKFTLLSRLLTFLTLILVVEFVQTVAEAKFETNQSPVINFFIQVAIALSILPVESLLRKFITSQQAKRIEALNEKNKQKTDDDTK